MNLETTIIRLREASRHARAAAEIVRTVVESSPDGSTSATAETAALHLGIFAQDLATEAASLERYV